MPVEREWIYQPVFAAESLVPYSAQIDYGDLADLLMPRKWPSACVINTLLVQFNKYTKEYLHSVDCQIMANWIAKVEEQARIRISHLEPKDGMPTVTCTSKSNSDRFLPTSKAP